MTISFKFAAAGAAALVGLAASMPAGAMPAAPKSSLAVTESAITDVQWRPRGPANRGPIWRGGAGWRGPAWRGPGPRWAYRPGYRYWGPGWGWGPAVGFGIAAGAIAAGTYYNAYPGPGYCRVRYNPPGPPGPRWAWVPCNQLY